MNTHLGICILARQRVAIPLERMVAAILYGISLQCVAVGTQSTQVKPEPA